MTHIKKKLGNWGEDIAEEYLKEKGYIIIGRNFNKKWGEIDIIATKPRKLFHVEQSRDYQKIVPRETKIVSNIKNVLRGTFFNKQKSNVNKMGKEKNYETIVFIEVKTLHKGLIRPEENITQGKMRRIIRTCQLYLSEKGYKLDETDWQIDSIGIVVDKDTGDYKIDHIEQAIY